MAKQIRSQKDHVEKMRQEIQATEPRLKNARAEGKVIDKEMAKPDIAISYVTPDTSAAAQTVDDVVDVVADDPIADATTTIESADTTVSQHATEMLSWRCLQHGIYELPANRSCDAVCPRCQAPLVRTAPPNLSEDDESVSESESDPSTSTA